MIRIIFLFLIYFKSWSLGQLQISLQPVGYSYSALFSLIDKVVVTDNDTSSSYLDNFNVNVIVSVTKYVLWVEVFIEKN